MLHALRYIKQWMHQNCTSYGIILHCLERCYGGGYPCEGCQKMSNPWCRRPARPFVGLHGMAQPVVQLSGRAVDSALSRCTSMQHDAARACQCSPLQSRVEIAHLEVVSVERPSPRRLPTKTPQRYPSLGAAKFCNSEGDFLGGDAQSTLGLLTVQNCVQHNTPYMR